MADFGSSSFVTSSVVLSTSSPNRKRKSSRLLEKEQHRERMKEQVKCPPTFKFGVISDIQYAPVDDGVSFWGVPRYYKHAMDVAAAAAGTFEAENVDLCVNLGDIIDGKCTTEVKDKYCGLDSMKDVVSALSNYTRGPIIHTYGNHELYNVDRNVLGDILNIPFAKEPCGNLVGYHSFVKHDVCFIVIDSYDVTMSQREETCKKYQRAKQILEENNPNFSRNINSPEGLTGVQRRFVAFNGGLDKPQLEWLDRTLETVRNKKQKAIILSHQPIHPKSTKGPTLIWNYDEVLQILRKYRKNVALSLCGHAHRGGYHRDEPSGIHFRVIEAALESPRPINTFGIVDVYKDRLVLRGRGDCESAIYSFSHLHHKESSDIHKAAIPED